MKNRDLDNEWNSYNRHPKRFQKVIGKSKSMDGEDVYHCGEFVGVATKSIMIKTWHYEESILDDSVFRVTKYVTEWKPL